MGKHSKYARKYKKSWEEQAWAKGWLREYKEIKEYNPNDVNEAYCLYCHTSLRAHMSDLKKHATQSRQHIQRTKNLNLNKMSTISNYVVSTSLTKDQKTCDVKLALYIANHSATNSVDHLGVMLTELGVGSKLENLRLHRTKCGALIKNVIGKAILKDIIEDVGTKRYSIILDESTDVSVNKYMAFCIRYFSENSNEIITDFLGLVQIERASANDLYESFKLYFKQIGLPLQNMLAIGTDGASNLCGQQHSLYTLLKEEIPDLILTKCVCHSIHLSVSKASEELPDCLDFLSREIYNWFSNSPLRCMQYKQIFDLINIGEDKKFRKFIQLSTTRWLARYNVIQRILEHWLELTTFFNIAANKEKCFSARKIHEMLTDAKNKAYFEFLKPVLYDANQLNTIFQSGTCDVGSAYYSMFLSIESLARRIIKPVFLNLNNYNKKDIINVITNAANNDLAYLPPKECDLGCAFAEQPNISFADKLEMYEKCFNFLKRLLKEMVKRLPSNVDIYRNVKTLNAYACTSPSHEHFMNLPIITFIMPNESKDLIENQWRKLPLVAWQTEFGGELPKNVSDFWPKVLKFSDAASCHIFKELSTVVLRLLSLPISNAVVERVFSIMNIVKTKLRNCMKLDMLESIIRIRMYLKNRKLCCKSFQPTNEMLHFDASMYQTDIQNEELDAAMELFSNTVYSE